MDQLALLCTLHADGPRTLRLLREVGCHSMEALGRLPNEELAGVLHLPAAAARRLSREATRLGGRLDPELEPEEVTYPPAAALLEQRADGLPFNAQAVAEEVSPDPLQRLDLRDRDLLERVMGSRKSSGPLAPEKSLIDAPRESVIPDIAKLAAGDVEGLDEETCQALRAGNITTLADLVSCSVDDLVSRIGMPFIRARTLQFRAGKRAGDRQSSRAKAPTESRLPERRLSPSEGPRPEPEFPPEEELSLDTERSFIIPRPMPLEEGSAAGPFA